MPEIGACINKAASAFPYVKGANTYALWAAHILGDLTIATVPPPGTVAAIAAASSSSSSSMTTNAAAAFDGHTGMRVPAPSSPNPNIKSSSSPSSKIINAASLGRTPPPASPYFSSPLLSPGKNKKGPSTNLSPTLSRLPIHKS